MPILYNVMVTVNLPDHMEVAFQDKNVTMDEVTEKINVLYSNWTSFVITATRAGALVGEPA